MRLIGMLFLFAAGCATPDAGERCNPLAFSSNGIQGDCADGLACVYPTGPGCGVAYCCKVGADGVTDTHPGCQPDPTSAEECMLDLGTADGDGGQ